MDFTNQAILSIGTRVINEILESRLSAVEKGNKPDPVNGEAHDFFDIVYKFSNPEGNRNVIQLKMSFPLMNKLANIIQNSLKQFYKDSISFEANSTAVLQYDLTCGEISEEIRKAQFLKFQCISALVNHFIDAADNSKTPEKLTLPLGRSDKLYLMVENQVFWLFFSIYSEDSAYFLFLKQFAQELKNLQKYNNMAPSVAYNERDPPQELKKGFNVSTNSNTIYLSMMVDGRLFSRREMIAKIIAIMPMQIYYSVANYNMFFIARLRDQSVGLMKRINRCKYEKPVEKKTASGRTFASK